MIKDAKFYSCGQIPVIGQEIHVGGAMYMSHGKDDFAGGIAIISEIKEGVSGGEPCIMINISERPGWSYNWTFLETEQEKLKEIYGNVIAHADPDTSLESNSWISPGDVVTTTTTCPKTGEAITTKRIADKYES